MFQLKSVPVKWLSPETLERGVFSSKTDVWSFGVLTWEIYTHTKTDTFPTKTNAEAMQIIRNNEVPMAAPEGSPELVQKVMSTCFERDLAKRPDFVQILNMVAPEEEPPKPND